jgi:hypothetical protein
LDFEKFIFSKGNTENISIPKKRTQFKWIFSGCHPSLCAYRITIWKKTSGKIIQSEKELKLSLIKLIMCMKPICGKINEYDIDQNSEEGNGFKAKKRCINLK